MNENEKKEVFSLSDEQIEEIRQKAIEDAKKKPHKIRQRGVYLVCVSCEYTHTVARLQATERLIGFNPNGIPIIKDISKQAHNLNGI